MNTELILQHIQGIWETLLQGDEEEQKIANSLFLVYAALQEKWLSLKKKTGRVIYEQSMVDEVEVFLQHIADL